MTPTPLPRWMLPLLGLVLLLQSLGLWLMQGSQTWVNGLNTVGSFTISALVAYWFWQVSQRSSHHLRRLWQRMAGFAGVFVFLPLLYVFNPSLINTTKAGVMAPTFVLSWGFLIWAISQLWTPRMPLRHKLRQHIDTAGAVLAVLLVLWRGYQGMMYVQYGETSSFSFWYLFQIIALALTLSVLFSSRESHGFVAILAVGLLLINGTHISYAWFRITEADSLPIGWMLPRLAGLVVMAYAAQHSLTLQTPQRTQRYVALIEGLPRVLFVLAFAITMETLGARTMPDSPMRITAYMFSAIAVLVFLRQMITLTENAALNRELLELNQTLEHRVEERSHELETSRNHLLAAERLASLGQLTAGLAHEVNTPLAAAMTSLRQADALAREYQDSIGVEQVSESDHREIAKELNQQIQQSLSTLDRLGEIVRKMRAQTRNQNEGKTRSDLSSLVSDTLDLLQHHAMKAKVSLSLQASQPLWIECEPGRVSQVMTNLITNALHACEDAQQQDPTKGKQVEVVVKEQSGEIWIEVRDDGVGIPEAVRERIFEPLFTTKEAGRGTGLGLPIVRDIVNSNLGGTLEFESQLGQGTTFRIRLPKTLEANTKPVKVLA